MKKAFLAFMIIIIPCITSGQGIAITIDDVPNKSNTQDGKPILLDIVQEEQTPAAIFINENPIYNHESLKILEQWIADDLITAGNHTFNHVRYSTVGLENYINEILLGQTFTSELTTNYKKELKFFRAPYNDLGIGENAHKNLQYSLDTIGYINTPFTVESADWLYNSIYQHRLNNGDEAGAREIGEMYVKHTMDVLNYIEGVLKAVHGRHVNHIYLCHDNAINRDYLAKLINEFRGAGYDLISLEEALCDPIYLQDDHYYEKWGISWAYRWIENTLTRNRIMQNEPQDTKAQYYLEQIENNN